ncbi:hypothetical protein [Mammaliicoccus sciuri]|uniref:hypothetical protein n=1 Tax=Mammaliicoccus sciuri TaxID=1296 RepID=UPI002DBA7E6B|nr:hypothetical protein [Mammaliicoccus sciuri]MEB6292228.1 hypothetical protein [Mammaliicoccus sciuri]
MELGHLKSEAIDIRNERDRYKKESHELSEKLDIECEENYKLDGQLHDMTKQRDSLIKDVEKLREELRMHIQCNDELGRVNKLKDKTISELRVISNNYTNLTEHIRDKANNNPSEHRYFRLVHFIVDLEAD